MPFFLSAGHGLRRMGLAAVTSTMLVTLSPSSAQACAEVSPREAARMTDLINADRRTRGLPPVRHEPNLARVAQGHACDMARNGFFGHTGSGNVPFAQRVRAAGLRGCILSENLAMGVRSSQQAHRVWMQSAGHRQNILRPDTTHVGLGIATPRNGRGMRWVTVFAAGC